MESVLYQTRNLQRFEKPSAPVFIFGSYLGALVLTDTRLMFLSTGGAGLGRAFAEQTLGLLSPAVLGEIDIALGVPGSLVVPHARLIDCSGQRRWDFGRYLRLSFEDPDGSETVNSFIPRGMASSRWIEDFCVQLNAVVSTPG